MTDTKLNLEVQERETFIGRVIRFEKYRDFLITRDHNIIQRWQHATPHFYNIVVENDEGEVRVVDADFVNPWVRVSRVGDQVVMTWSLLPDGSRKLVNYNVKVFAKNQPS